MKKFDDFRRAFRTKSFVLGIVLFSLLMLAGHSAVKAQKSAGWKLREVRVANLMDSKLGSVTSERYDHNGGTVEINVRGDSICQGGTAKLRFIWKFTNSVDRVAQGNTIGIALEAGQVSGNKPCAKEFANRSYFFSRGGEGARFSHFSPAEANLLEERFADTNSRARATADPNGERTASDGVKVKADAVNPKTPWAIFEIVIETPTASGGGFLHYTYVYELDGSRTNAGNSSGCADVVGTWKWSVEMKNGSRHQAELKAFSDGRAVISRWGSSGKWRFDGTNYLFDWGRGAGKEDKMTLSGNRLTGDNFETNWIRGDRISCQ